MKKIDTGLSEREQEMFFEIADVMSKYNDIDRKYNLALDHQHFPINKGEVLYETNDPAQRTLTNVILTEDNLPSNALATQWELSTDSTNVKTVRVTSWCCDD